MKKFAPKLLVAFAFALLTLGANAATTTKTVTWELPANWDAEVAYPEVQGYRAIDGGGELRARAGLGKVGEPDLPYYLINVALPDNGTFGEVTAEAEWEEVEGNLLPFPILEPVPSGTQPTLPTLSAAYNRVYPTVIAKEKYLEIASGVRMMPISVTPFKWDGMAKKLYRAKRLTVTATYTVPASRLRLSTSSLSTSSAKGAGNADLRKMALSMTINPNDATTSSGGLRLTTSSVENPSLEVQAEQGDPTTADFIILSPHNFVDLWKEYATFRKGTEIGSTHEFAVVDTRKIYEKFTTEHDDALKIHHYLEGIYKLGKIKYVLLGATPKKYNYNPDTMILTRYVVAGGGLNQISDEYYGCMDRLPVGSGVEVWDYDGDGYYMGHRNANGSYTHDNPAYVDFKQDIIVFRFPLMEKVVDSGYEFTARQQMDNFKAKVTYLESDDYAHKYSYCLSGSTVFGTVYRGGTGDTRGMTELTTRERKFFDGNMNTFDPDHATSASDSELMPRDRHWEFLTRLRGNTETYQYNSTQSNATWNDMYDNSGAVFNIWAHGWARGCSPGNGESVMKMKGYYTFFINPIPCESGMMDFCTGYGITNTICFGEAPIVSPHGGLASYNNTRLGWVAGYKTSSNGGGYSTLIEHYLFQCLSGVTRWQEKGAYELMDAGEALMYAKNHYGDNYSSIMWGLAGVQVTGQGDPLARLPIQHSRIWDGHAGTTNWDTNDANWRIVGGNDHKALDQSRDIFLPIKDSSARTFTVDGSFTTAGFFVEQNAGDTLEIAGDSGSFKVFREAIVTNGNLRWTAAGGIGRNGIRFVGNTRGNIDLPGNAERYFGDNFVNVGTISVRGGGVTIDTPRNAAFGAGKPLDFEEIEFVAANADDVTAWNTLRSRNPGLFRTNPEKHLRVVNSKLNLETYNIGGSGAGNKDKPLLFVTNSTIRVRANPRWYEGTREEYFVRPTYLHNATLEGCYAMFAFGPDATTGYDLYVSGQCRIAGDTDIRLNGELRVHFLGANAELEIANTLCDGLSAGSVKFIGEGTVRVTATQKFTGTMTASSGVTIRCTIPNAIGGNLLVENGGKLMLDAIPLSGIKNLTVNAGGGLYLPATTAKGIYQVVDTTTCNIDLKSGYKLYDNTKTPAEEISGVLTEGYIIQTANVLYWKQSGGTWNFTEPNAWTNAEGVAKVYTDGLPLSFGDIGGAASIGVTVGADVAPGFMDFRNTIGRYTFTGSHTITLDSLALTKNVTFEAPLKVAGSLRVMGGSAQFGNVDAPLIEAAGGGELRITGEATVITQKIRKVRFEFSDTYSAGNRAAIQELRLYTAKGALRLPVGTVIKDIAGQTVNVVGWTETGTGLVLNGATGDEQLGALVDGKFGSGNNKWWASKSAIPTWFEITFPEAIDPLTGYNFCTADSIGRNPKAWVAYTSIDGSHWAKAAQVSNQGWVNTRTWMRNDNNPFNFINANGFLTVKDGGTLVADGLTHVNLEFQTGSTLAVINDCCITNRQSYAKLVLPETGTVKVDLSRAKSSSERFPILCGFNVTAEQFAKFACVQDTAMLHLQDGDIYAATSGIVVPPYTATISSGTTLSGIEWSDKYNTKFHLGSANIKANGEATLTVNGNVTLVNDVVGTIAKLKILGSKDLTINTNSVGVVFEPGTLDDSAHTGKLVWNIPIGSAAVIAGSDTQIGGGVPGTGLLTVNAGKKATLLTGVTFANQSVDNAGWIRYAGKRTDFEIEGLPDAIYSFEDADLTGVFTLPNKTIRSQAGDKVVLHGTNVSYYARSLLNFDIQGGLVEIDTHGPLMSFGQTGVGKATKFTQTGGKFLCYADLSETNGGLLMGYQGGTGEGCEISIKPTSGIFEVPTSFLNFFYPTLYHLTGDARLRAKGFISTQNPGTIILGTNVTTIATSAVLEIGSLGFRNNAATVTLYGNNQTANTSLLGYEDGAYIEQDVNVYGHSSLVYPVTVAATNNTTFTLRNMAFVFTRGAELVVFGDQSKNWNGTIRVDTLQSLPPRYKLNAGRLDLGDIGCSDSATMTAAPQNGAKIRVILPWEEYDAGAAISVLRCDSWAGSKTSDEIRSFLDLYHYDAEGKVVAVTDGTLKYLNGIINFIPEGGAGYVFPISATVNGNANWTGLVWKDRVGRTYDGNWSDVRSAELVCTGTGTVTMDNAISINKLATVTASGKTMTIEESGASRLTVTQIDDSSSAGTTILHITLGAGATVKAGKNLEVNGAPDTSTVHGKIQIPSGGTAIIRNGLWNGEIEMADSTSKLDFHSDTTYDTVPSSLGKATVGTITYYAAMVPSDGTVAFGSDTRMAADGTFNTRNVGFTCRRFITGVGNGTVQKFVLYSSGSSITVNAETDDDAIVLAQDPGSYVSLATQGPINAPNAILWLGKGGSATLSMHNNLTVKGICNNPEQATSSILQLYGSTLTVGSEGIDIVSDAKEPFYCAGTLATSANATIRVDPFIGCRNDTKLAPAKDTTMTIVSPLRSSTTIPGTFYITLNGLGMVVLQEEFTAGGNVKLNSGVLRLGRSGLLNASKVEFNGGTMEVVLTKKQTMGISGVQLFATDSSAADADTYTTVLVEGTLEEVKGNFTKQGNYIVFTPTDFPGAHAATTGNGTTEWKSLNWLDDKNQPIDPEVWSNALGRVTLTNAYNAVLSFADACDVAEFKLVNTGTLAFDGLGTLNAYRLDDSESTGRTTIGAFVKAMGSVTAGRDTVLAERGDGEVTVAAGMKVTIPGWTTPANVKGAGVVALDMGSREAAVETYWNKNAGISGTNQIVRGTWTFTNSDQYPGSKNILVSGTNAVMRFTTNSDITYSAGGSAAITVEDGGEFQVRKRDTFNRELYLRNGGKLLLSGDNDGSGRMLDMFTNSKISVSGAEPSVIGGENATKDSYGNPVNGSGIIAIRKANFTVDIAKDSVLKVYSRWNAGDSSSGNFTMTGKGTLEQYRESGNTLPFSKEGLGTLRLVNAGTVTTAGIVANFGTIEVVTSNGYNKTMGNAISGTYGCVVKKGLGSLTLSGANTFGGGVAVREGTLKLGNNAALSTGNVVCDAGTTLDLSTYRPTTAVTVNGLLKATITQTEKNGEQWVDLCTIKSGTTFDVANLTVYDTNGTTPLTDAETRIDNGKVQVRCQAYKMPIKLDTYSAVNAEWTGATWKDSNNTVIPSEKWDGLYGRTNLAVQIYAHNGNAVTLGICANIEVATLYISADTGKVTFNRRSDYGFKADSTELLGTLQVFDDVNLGALTGSGTLIATNFIPAYAGLTDPAKWTGTLQLWDVTTDALDLGTIANASARVELAGVTTTGLTVPSGITALVTCGEGLTPILGPVTFADGAILRVTTTAFARQITVTDGTLTMNPANTTLYVDGVLRPTGTWSVEGGTIKLPLTGPFKATVTGNAEWTALAWTDSSTTPVSVPAGFWATSTGSDNVELTVNAGATLTAGSAITVGTVKVSGNGAVTLPTSNLTMGNLLGDGIVSYAGWPTKFTGLTDANGWNGTLKLTGTLASISGLDFSTLGNTSSKIEIAGNMQGGYVAPGGTCAVPLCVSGTFCLNNGNSGGSNGYNFTGALTGSGTIKVTGGPSDVTKFTGDVSGFTGTVQTTNAGGQCIALGDQADEDKTKGMIVINQDVAVAAGKQWSAKSGVLVCTGKTVAVTPGTIPFSGNVTFEGASTLDVKADGSAQSYAIATGTLTISDTTVIKINDVAVSCTDWFVIGGSIVKPTNITVTSEGTSLTGHDGQPIMVTGVAGGYAVVNEPITPSVLIAKGDALTIKIGDSGVMTLSGGLVGGSTPVTLDASAVNAYAMATNAVYGAPYSHWLVRGAYSGTVDVTLPTKVPTGYQVTADKVEGIGIRLIVTAPSEAKFGVLSLNLHNGTALSVAGDHGLYPDVLANWGNLQATANANATVSNVTFTVGNNASGYNIDTYTDEIYHRYLDDSQGVTRTIAIGNIPFEKYRVIVYYSTDTANYQFQPLIVNDGTGDVYYAGATQLQNVKSYTVKGRNASWGHSGPDKNMNAINEGVNLLVTDVYTSQSLTLKFKRSGDPRATPCAIQIVKVGDIVVPTEPVEPFTLTIASAAGTVDWAKANWIALNEITVPEETWASPVGEARIVAEDGGSVTLNAPSTLSVASLGISGGTLAAPIAIDDTANAFASTQFTIAEEGVLKLKSSDNRTYKVSGAGAASSTLIVTGTKGWGFNAGASIRNVTLIADSSSYQTWLENRNPAVFDETVDVVSTNGSPITVGGGLVTIGSLAGDGNLSVNGAGTLTINMLRAPTTYSGVCAVPLTVNGTYPLTLTGANTCALTVNSGATVNLSDGGTVGSASGSGTINVNAGTLSAALGSALNMNFAENTTLNITATLTQGGSFPITTGTMTGSPAYTLNGAALPSYCRIEGGNLIVTPEQRAWNNPVTGDAQNFTFRFAGTSDASWTTIGNWRQYGTISWNTITGTAPMLSGSNRWDPTVIDGALISEPSRKTITLSGTNMEGWNPRLALFGGVNVTIGNMTKLQGDDGAKWIWVDETSKLTFTQIASGNFDRQFRLYVAGPEGVTFTQAIPKDGTTFEYYLGTKGSVKYDAAPTKCSHALKCFGVTLRTESCGRAVNARNLVTFPSSSTKDFTTTDATAVIGSGSGTKLDRMPTDADEIGSYYLTKESTALKVYFVDYATNILTVASGTTVRASDINAKAARTTDKLYVVFENGATIKMDAELTTEGVSYDFSAMTDGIILDCSEKNYEPNEYWRGFFFERKSTFTGVITISAGTLTLPFGSYINSITIAAGATLNLTGTLTGEEVVITTGTLTKNGEVTVNGQPIPGDWEIKDGKIVRIHWKYPVIYTIAASETSFTTKTATWKDSSNPQRVYAGGFDGQVDELTIDGSSYSGEDVAFEWTNDATILRTTNLTFYVSYYFSIAVKNAAGCSIVADTINGSIAEYNFKDIHLMFDTGAAKLIPGANMVLYGNGSGPVELTPYMDMNPTLTFNPSNSDDITYSGAITGTGKVVMDGEGSVALTGVNTFSGGLTVSNGVLSVVAATGLGTSVVTVESDATLKLPFGDYANNLSFTEGAKLDLTGTFPESGTYTITTGEMSGTPTVTINGEELGSGYQLEGKVITRIAPPSIIPIAVWDGDFKTLVKAGWTLAANGNTVSADGSTITIASNQKGVLLTRSAGTAAPSVIVEYEDLSLPTGANTGYVLATSYAKDSSGADTHQDRTGLAAKGTSGTATAVWNGEYNTTDGSGKSVPTSGRFGFVYKAGTSTSLFSATETLYSSTSLKAGADTAVKGFAIGGMRNTATTTASDVTYGPAAGMVIKRIAVFDTEITQEDVANFRWNAHTQTATWPTYRMFDENPNVFTWKGTDDFHKGPYVPFSIYSAADVAGISFTDSATTDFPGQIGTSITPWNALATSKYVAPGCVLRIAADTGKQVMNTAFSGLALGGMIVETGADGYSISNDSGWERATHLGDTRARGIDSWFVYNGNFTFARGSASSSADNTVIKLYGAVNFAIASGKTVTMNTKETNSSVTLDTGTSTWLKMHGEGQMVVNKVTATGNVTLDYTDLANRQSADPYISGTLKLDASTKIRLPANATSPYKLATALDASETAARRTIYIGDEEVLATVTFSKANGTMAFVVNYVMTINDGGTFVVPDGIDASKVVLIYEDGTPVDNQKVSGQTITYDFSYTNKVCWWDYEFNGNADNTGTEGGGLSWDGDRPFKDNEYTDNALRVPTRPYRGVTWPTEDTTFVIYGKMVKNDNAYQLCFGTKTGNLIFLATGNVAINEVVLCLSQSGTVTKLKTMTVPNAQASDHLYAFTLKTVENKTVIDIYLDGELLESYNVGSKISLGGGFQIASPHGGTVSGYSRTADNDPATIDFLRVYKCELTAETMAAYAEEYPYVSPNGSYVREVEGGDVTWDADSQWYKIKPGEEASTTNQPAANATVGLVAGDDTTVTMNFDKDVTYEAMTIAGEGEVTITNAAEATGQIKITGRLTVNTDATIDARAIDVANTPVTIAEGKTLTIDMTHENLDDLLQTTVIKLTGAATTGFGSDVAVRTGEVEEIEGRTFTVEANANQHYEMTVEVVPEEVKLGMSINQGEVEFGTKQIDIPLDWALQLTNTTALTHGNVTKTTVAEALNATDTIPNKIKPWESYILGLSPTNQFSKPVIAPVQAGETDKITFALTNIKPTATTTNNMDVTYKVYSGATIGAKTEESDPAGVGEQIKFALPDSGVKYYHIEVNITPKQK